MLRRKRNAASNRDRNEKAYQGTPDESEVKNNNKSTHGYLLRICKSRHRCLSSSPLQSEGHEGVTRACAIFHVFCLSISLALLLVSSGSNKRLPPMKIYPTSINFHQNHAHESRQNILLPFFYDENHKAKLRDDTDEFEVGNCKAMDTWQLENRPNCNLLHEINDYRSTKLLSSGSYRETWLIKWNGVALAMKTLVSGDDMSARNLERHRRDAVVMSMLSSSIHIPNIYAHCGDSGIFDYSPGGSMERIIRSTHTKEREGMWSNEEMLRYAWQVAAGLSDVHRAGNRYGSPAIAHTDIDTDQVLWIDGMFKLNDFNRARFIRWDNVKKVPCTFYIASAPGVYRSPEEYAAARNNLQTETLTPKLDVYTLGNIFYTILTKERVFKYVEKEEAQELVMEGKFPSIPHEKRSTFSAMEKSIFQAMKMCHVLDVEARSSAQEVEQYLRHEMEMLNVPFI